MAKNNDNAMQEYALSGGGTVRVYKPMGTQQYFAIVEQNGRYPEAGKIARNRGRKEYSVILDGKFQYEINGEKFELQRNDRITVGDGQRYTIEGSGRVLVFVEDGIDGKTLIEDI